MVVILKTKLLHNKCMLMCTDVGCVQIGTNTEESPQSKTGYDAVVCTKASKNAGI